MADDTHKREHAAHMARALALARRGRFTAQPNPLVGCVLTRGNSILGEGFHQRAGAPHAEIEALGAAGAEARGASCYVTLEPCCHHGRTPPCTAALIDAGVARVVVAMRDPNPKVAGRGLLELERAGIEVEVGLLRDAARALNPGFVKRMQTGLPYVRLKLAVSVDGRTATHSGASQWISSDPSRRDVQRLRAGSGAIVTGIGTVLADDPRLTVREAGLRPADAQPLRVVVDSRLRCPATARMLAQPGRTIIATRAADGAAAGRLRAAGAELMPLAAGHGGVSIEALLRALATLEINDVLVEAGPRLSGAFVQAGLADELVLYVAPRLLGHEGRGLLELAGIVDLDAGPRLEFTAVRAVGPDLRISARPVFPR